MMARGRGDAGAQSGQRTILFVDEIHRFNKAQQDAFLPYVEDGDIMLIGATTENPSFEVNAALLSRSKVFVLEPLARADRSRSCAARSTDDDARPRRRAGRRRRRRAAAIAVSASGDARAALNLLELAAALGAGRAGPARHHAGLAERALAAADPAATTRAATSTTTSSRRFTSRMRSSDPDAAVYWLARMLEAGEDPLFIARRLVRFATEDIGLADPQALAVAVAAQAGRALHRHARGQHRARPGGDLPGDGAEEQRRLRRLRPRRRRRRAPGAEPVPLHLRNAPTRLMKQLGYGKGYQYAHDQPDAVPTWTACRRR